MGTFRKGRKIKKKAKQFLGVQRKYYDSNHDLPFYLTRDWIYIKKIALKIYGNTCMCCGKRGLVHVDHIKPRSKYPELEISIHNLQILCPECNKKKLNYTEKDYRTKAHLQRLSDLYDTVRVSEQEVKKAQKYLVKMYNSKS